MLTTRRFWMLSFAFCVAHKKVLQRNCCIILNRYMQRHSANWLMVFFFLWCYLFFSSFEVYSYKNDQFDNLISFWKESTFKMHSKRKVVWIALVTSLSCHCLVIVLYVYMYLSKIFQYVQMWLYRWKYCLFNGKNIYIYVYFRTSHCPQMPKTLVATKLQYDKNIRLESLVKSKKEEINSLLKKSL